MNEIDAETEFLLFLNEAKKLNILECLRKHTDKIVFSYIKRYGENDYLEDNWKYFEDTFNHAMKESKEFHDAMIKLKNVDSKYFDIYYSTVSALCF